MTPARFRRTQTRGAASQRPSVVCSALRMGQVRVPAGGGRACDKQIGDFLSLLVKINGLYWNRHHVLGHGSFASPPIFCRPHLRTYHHGRPPTSQIIIICLHALFTRMLSEWAALIFADTFQSGVKRILKSIRHCGTRGLELLMMNFVFPPAPSWALNLNCHGGYLFYWALNRSWWCLTPLRLF